jgi:hypothetical protein
MHGMFEIKSIPRGPNHHHKSLKLSLQYVAGMFEETLALPKDLQKLLAA